MSLDGIANKKNIISDAERATRELLRLEKKSSKKDKKTTKVKCDEHNPTAKFSGTRSGSLMCTHFTCGKCGESKYELTEEGVKREWH